MAGKPGWAAVSKIQARAFASTAKGATLLDDERSNLVEAAQGAGFADADFELVCSSLTPKDAPEKQPRRAMQNYEAILDFLTAEEWERILDADCTPDEVMQIIFDRLAKLGARCPEEGTKQLCDCLVIVCTEGVSKPISNGKKAAMYQIVKKSGSSLLEHLVIHWHT